MQAGPPEGHLLAPRPLLEDVSGKAHVLPAGAEQDYLGGARTLPEPVAGGLRRLWLRVVSVTGPGVVVASWPFMPQSQACPHGSAIHQAAGIFLGGRASLPLRLLSSTPYAPCTPHPAHLGRWSAVCRRRSAVGGGAGVRPWLAPCTFPSWGLLPRGRLFLGGRPAGVEQEDPLRRCAHPGLRSLPYEQTSPGKLPRRSRRAKPDRGTAVNWTKLTTKGVLPRLFCKPLSKSHFEQRYF